MPSLLTAGICGHDLIISPALPFTPQTGMMVFPQLHVANGISGAIQRRAGLPASKTIVAVNMDPEAPVTEFADTGVVGDLRAALPAVTGRLRAGASRHTLSLVRPGADALASDGTDMPVPARRKEYRRDA